jgi:hypothetical protein
MKYILSFLLFLSSGSFFYVTAQDRIIINQHLKKLTSPSFHGRGYVKNGDAKAAHYIAKQFEFYGLETIGGNYYQTYMMRMNTFPATPKIQINHKKLKAGEDFVVGASSTSITGSFPCIYLPLSSEQLKLDLSKTFLIGDQEYKELLRENTYGAIGFIYLNEQQPIWSVWPGKDTSSYHIIQIAKSAIDDSVREMKLKVRSQFKPSYSTQNVWALVKGSKHPDSLIILGAHYDHLGRMGQVLFPGANDNASGTVMVMELARYFSKAENQPECSIVFALFSGEEAGLLGSKYMAENFPFDDSKVKYMINLDMVGAGSEGIKMVNATRFLSIYEGMKKINDEKGYLTAVKSRGESCNSDHCPFYEKGIPSIFIYTLGPETKAYHIPQDNYEGLPLTAFEDLFCLIRDFVEEN